MADSTTPFQSVAVSLSGKIGPDEIKSIVEKIPQGRSAVVRLRGSPETIFSIINALGAVTASMSAAVFLRGPGAV